MGKIDKKILEEAKSLKEIASYICKQAWGGAIVDEQNKVIYTNKPSFFIGAKGANIKAYSHLGSIKIKSLQDLGLEELDYEEDIVKPYKEEGVKTPHISFRCAPSNPGRDIETYRINENLIEYINNCEVIGSK